MAKQKLQEEEKVEETPVEETAEETKTTPTKGSTTFVFKNGGTRTFSKEVHGAKWEDLADEFQETNKITILSRDGKEVK